jgi:hypothetical protein
LESAHSRLPQAKEGSPPERTSGWRLDNTGCA